MPCFFKKMGWQSLLHGKMNLNVWDFRLFTNFSEIKRSLAPPGGFLAKKNAIPFLCFAPHYSRSSLVILWREEQIISAVQFLCCSSLSQKQSHPIQKWGADQLCSSFSELLLAVPMQWQSCPTQKQGELVPPGPSIAFTGAPMLPFLSIP